MPEPQRSQPIELSGTDFAALLQAVCNARNIRHRDLAAAIGRTPKYLSDIMKRRTFPKTSDAAALIAAAGGQLWLTVKFTVEVPDAGTALPVNEEKEAQGK